MARLIFLALILLTMVIPYIAAEYLSKEDKK